MSGEFLDTTILVYAFDRDAGSKRSAARDLVDRLAQEESGLLSIQVLMELFAVLTRKFSARIRPSDVATIIESLSAWTIHSPLPLDVIDAVRIAAAYRISPWDASIVQSASALGATKIWSEDFSAGQRYEGIPVENPFA
ncbi:MAG: PIN domain-containing protein [Deltaproteobacteria bacterium]|nr:PIN domain-containing protein [Deltaproteobacteria bacterium]